MHMTVLASTEAAPGVDALTLSAERAAYKLLYRLMQPSAAVAEIEGRAALRQGMGLLAAYARGENGTADMRKTALEKAVTNLDFASQTLRGDGSAAPWPEVLRYRAIACFVTGDFMGAMHTLQRIQDTKCTCAERTKVIEWFGREACHNLAVVLTRLGGVPNIRLAQSLFTSCIREGAADRPLDGISVSAHLGRVTALAALDSEDWRRLAVAELQATGDSLRDSWAALHDLKPDATDTPRDRRIIEFVRTEFSRAFGMAWSRYLFAQPRPLNERVAKPLEQGDISITVRTHKDFGAWIRTHRGETREQLAFSHLSLVNVEYGEAHAFAMAVVAMNPKAEFAYYLAAEASFQDKKIDRAREVSALWTDAVSEPVFRMLRDALIAPAQQPVP
jgi:hypothetical protein